MAISGILSTIFERILSAIVELVDGASFAKSVDVRCSMAREMALFVSSDVDEFAIVSDVPHKLTLVISFW